MGSQPRSSMCGDFYRAFSDRDYYRSLSIQGQHSRLFRNRETFTTIGAYQFKVNSSLKISDLLRRPSQSADNMPIFLHIGISPSISTKFATICMVMFQFVLIKNSTWYLSPLSLIWVSNCLFGGHYPQLPRWQKRLANGSWMNIPEKNQNT